jgi:hypothetical protein
MPQAKSEQSPESSVTVKSTGEKAINMKARKEQLPSKRSYLKQTDVPIASLDDALRLPQAIFDHYAGQADCTL